MEMMDEKKVQQLNKLAVIASIVVPALVIILMTPDLLPKITLPFKATILPAFYASINALTAVVLVFALIQIKQRNVKAHKRLVTFALVLSVIFLASYVIYHLAADSTKYGDLDHNGIVDEAEKLAAGTSRYIYVFFLLTHILLSAIIIPFVLFTYIRGLARMDEKHRKLARITFPMWLYVAVTGVIVYVMLSPYYA